MLASEEDTAKPFNNLIFKQLYYLFIYIKSPPCSGWQIIYLITTELKNKSEGGELAKQAFYSPNECRINL